MNRMLMNIGLLSRIESLPELRPSTRIRRPHKFNKLCAPVVRNPDWHCKGRPGRITLCISLRYESEKHISISC